MTVRQKLRIWADIAMTVLLFPLMAYSLVGETVHEWLGSVMCLLFLCHHILNKSWYKGLAKGRWKLPLYEALAFGQISKAEYLTAKSDLSVSCNFSSRYFFLYRKNLINQFFIHL